MFKIRSTNEHHTFPIKSCCVTLERMTGLEPAIACLEGKGDNHYATSAKTPTRSGAYILMNIFIINISAVFSIWSFTITNINICIFQMEHIIAALSAFESLFFKSFIIYTDSGKIRQIFQRIDIRNCILHIYLLLKNKTTVFKIIGDFLIIFWIYITISNSNSKFVIVFFGI